MGNEIAIRKDYSITDLETMANKIAKSGVFPGIKTPEQAFTIMMLSESEGIHPMKALQRYHLMPSGPTKKSETMLADYISSGGKVTWIISTDKECEAEFDYPATGKIKIKWTIERASRIKTYIKDGKQHYLTEKDNWINYPESQLRWRCAAEGIRVSNPNITVGLYAYEEELDFIGLEKKNKMKLGAEVLETVKELKPTSPEAPQAPIVDGKEQGQVHNTTVVPPSPFYLLDVFAALKEEKGDKKYYEFLASFSPGYKHSNEIPVENREAIAQLIPLYEWDKKEEAVVLCTCGKILSNPKLIEKSMTKYGKALCIKCQQKEK